MAKAYTVARTFATLVTAPRRTVKRQTCKTRSDLYESVCKLCNPQDERERFLLPGSKDKPSERQEGPKKRQGIYIGE